VFQVKEFAVNHDVFVRVSVDAISKIVKLAMAALVETNVTTN
jgi:hypothetical protein